MPSALLVAYARQLPVLRGQRSLDRAMEASFPHLDKKDRTKLVDGWQGTARVARNLSREDREDMARAIGIVVEKS